MERVLVIFQATGTRTESLALAFGLGAVEGGANIRLRHLPGSTPAALEHQGYGHLKDIDIEWAEVVGLAIEAPEPVEELASLVEQIRAYQKTSNLSGKWIYVFGNAARTQAIGFAEDALHTLGFSPLEAALSDDPQYLKTVGQKLTSLSQPTQAS